MLGNDGMKTVSTEVTSIRRQSNRTKTMRRTHQYFADFEVESTSKFPRQIDFIIST